MGVVVGRHINGIPFKPLEYLLDSAGEIIVFQSEEYAKNYLRDRGFTEKSFRWLVFEKTGAERMGKYENYGRHGT